MSIISRSFNDRYGHAGGGDDALAAGRCPLHSRTCIRRPGDYMLPRYGPAFEEFAVLLHPTSGMEEHPSAVAQKNSPSSA
ncbi:hypothetical protein ACU4GD_20675 [Cupriavidus basilensis]